jgi:hypothetical protein
MGAQGKRDCLSYFLQMIDRIGTLSESRQAEGGASTSNSSMKPASSRSSSSRRPSSRCSVRRSHVSSWLRLPVTKTTRLISSARQRFQAPMTSWFDVSASISSVSVARSYPQISKQIAVTTLGNDRTTPAARKKLKSSGCISSPISTPS